MRFIIRYPVGNHLREDTIEAENLDLAVEKAEYLHPRWADVICTKISKAEQGSVRIEIFILVAIVITIGLGVVLSVLKKMDSVDRNQRIYTEEELKVTP